MNFKKLIVVVVIALMLLAGYLWQDYHKMLEITYSIIQP